MTVQQIAARDRLLHALCLCVLPDIFELFPCCLCVLLGMVELLPDVLAFAADPGAQTLLRIRGLLRNLRHRIRHSSPIGQLRQHHRPL